jgi:hypothetical protein
MEIARHFCGLAPQLLFAVTHTSPLVVERVTETVLVPCPEVIVAPAGTVQLYVKAPATEAML